MQMTACALSPTARRNLVSYRYKRAPQGFASSGDGYNRRFDEVMSDFKRHKRCVDDVIHYDDELEDHWWRSLELLQLLGRNGIVVNPDKLQFKWGK